MFEYQGKDLNRDYFYIDWKIGSICNYQCSYCSQNQNKSNLPFPNKEQITNAINVIKSFNHNEYEFSLAGGETTLFPDLRYTLEQITKEFDNKLLKLSIISNCSKDIDYFKELSKDIPLWIYFSIHPEYIKNISVLKDKIIQLSEIVNLQVGISFLKTNNLNDIILAVDNLFEDGIKFYPRIYFLRDGINVNAVLDSYIESDKVLCLEYNHKWKKSITNDRGYIWKPNKISNLEHNYALINNYTNFKNMWCTTSTTNLWIRDNGYCSGAVCDQAIKSKFSIYDGINPYLLKDYCRPVKCTLDCCGCKDNLLIPKFKSKKEAEDYVSKSICNNRTM